MDKPHNIAVIDLGTNTFHLLIVSVNSHGDFSEVFRERQFVALAENGINQIGEKPFERGLKTIKRFKEVIDSYEVKKIKAFGTAALRTANNAIEFVQKIKEETGIRVERISGGDEALLIADGVRLAVPEHEEPLLIMDIGGGSVEFIIASMDEVLWAESFPIGVAVLYNKFHKSEPIADAEISELWSFLDNELAQLKTALDKVKPSVLVGASGTFDVLAEVLGDGNGTGTWAQVQSNDFFPLCDKLVASNLEERLEMEGIPQQRAKLIVVAIILIKYILSIHEMQKIWISKYAMKEGMISDMIKRMIH